MISYLRINFNYFAAQDYESRISFLRSKATKSSTVTSSSNDEPPPETADDSRPVETSQHVDLFSDFEDKMKKVKPMDEEKRLEQEKYEKQIGYLMYLGQDTNEALGKRNWYDVAPKRSEDDAEERPVEVGLKVKHLHDPMLRFLKKPFAQKTPSTPSIAPIVDVVSPSRSSKASDTIRSPGEKEKMKKSKKKKRKHHHHKDKRKRKHSSSGSDASDTDAEIKRHKLDNLRKLREKRLQREKAEQERAKEFLIEKFPALAPPPVTRNREKSTTPFERPVPFVKQKYNSQFNPVLAKQNYN